MFRECKWKWSIVVVATLLAYAVTTNSLWAKGGGGGHGGGGHHAGGHHGGEHHANHHPYHPSHHHEEHHASHHDDHHDGHHDDHHVAHHNHHHENWHHGNWGPGYWGGYGGYAYAPWGWGGDGGDTYVDNSTNVTPASNDYADNGSDDSNDSASDTASSEDSSDNQSSADDSSSASNSDNGFPTDDWPELGVVTYAGEYGASQGQVIVSMVPGSAASKAGFVPGDVILSLNGQPVPSADDLDTVLDHATGEFSAEVWDARTGRKSTIDGKLDANAPATTETAAFAPQP